MKRIQYLLWFCYDGNRDGMMCQWCHGKNPQHPVIARSGQDNQWAVACSQQAVINKGSLGNSSGILEVHILIDLLHTALFLQTMYLDLHKWTRVNIKVAHLTVFFACFLVLGQKENVTLIIAEYLWAQNVQRSFSHFGSEHFFGVCLCHQ